MPRTVVRTPHFYYRQMTTEQKQCRGRGVHMFPDLDPSADQLPDGFRVLSHDGQGRYVIQQTCLNECGRFRVWVAIWEDGHFHKLHTRKYGAGDDWVVVPFEIVLTPRMITGFLMDECRRLLEAAARASNGARKSAKR